jgi:hypothetical protein
VTYQWSPCLPGVSVKQLSASDYVRVQIDGASSVSGDAPPWQPGALSPSLHGMPGYNDVPFGEPAPPGMIHAAAKRTSCCDLPAGWESVMGLGSAGTNTGPLITRCEFTSDSAGHATEDGKKIGVGAAEALDDALDLLHRHQASYQSCNCTLSGKCIYSSDVDALHAQALLPIL